MSSIMPSVGGASGTIDLRGRTLRSLPTAVACRCCSASPPMPFALAVCILCLGGLAWPIFLLVLLLRVVTPFRIRAKKLCICISTSISAISGRGMVPLAHGCAYSSQRALKDDWTR